MPEEKVKVGVSVAGGAARGLAHLGTLDYFKEKDYKISALSGCSMGSIISAMAALGKPADEIVEISKTFKFFSLMKPTWPRIALNKIDRFRDYISGIFGEFRFEDTCIPLRIVASDVDTGEEVVFSSGLLWPAVLSSAAIPVIFEPFEVDGRRLCDGGLLRINPSVQLKEFDLDAIIGSDIGLVRMKTGPVRGIVDYMKQCMELFVTSQRKESEDCCDLTLRPDILTESFLNFSKGEHYRKLGYEACLREAEALEKIFSK